MQKIFLLTSFVFSILVVTAQNSIPFSEIIKARKKSSIPIIGSDTTSKNRLKHRGTGFFVNYSNNCVVLITAEHVVVIKDSLTNKTIRPLQNLYANVNLANDSTILVPLDLIYRDEVSDFAILQLKQPVNFDIKKGRINLEAISFSQLDEATDLKEGELLLYIGYPMSLGVGTKSYPVSRQGFVSQNVIESNKFLMDGFVQGGYSGSPVYRIKTNPQNSTWTFKVVGIIQAYPNDYTQTLNSKEKIVINPGFTIVGKLKEVIKTIADANCTD